MPKVSKKISPQSGFAPVPVLVAVLVIAGLVAASANIRTTNNYSQNQSVLGENSLEVKGKTREVTKQSQEQQREQQKKQSEQRAGQINFQSEGAKQEMEIQSPMGIKVKYKVEDGNQVKLEIENEPPEVGDLKEASGGSKTASQEGRPALKNITTTSHFPLSINTATNQLIVTTPAGQRVVAVLPDKAVSNMLANGVITQLNPPVASKSGELGEPVKIASLDGQLVYQVEGSKTYKVFGFLPVSLPVTAYVSADSGNMIASTQSILSNLLGLLSPR